MSISTADTEPSTSTSHPVATGATAPRAKVNIKAFSPMVAAAIALAVHLLWPSGQPGSNPRLYPLLLVILLGATAMMAACQLFWSPVRRWLWNNAPLLGAGIVLLTVWDAATLKLNLLPLPYFPGPGAVFQSLADDWRTLFDCTWRSLALLLSGYVLGAMLGVTCGVLIGWSPRWRYWGMPVLKTVGPIPATAFIPLALLLFPSAFVSGMALIALTVWFPVTMLTSSGIANVRLSYLDVARTLGAGRRYLVFRVAIPAALPSIFIGLFMGLGSSFLTLIVAETVGVKSGLGWYVSWAQGWAEYSKVYAALLIMAVFFSSIMTLLFRIRDRVLVWQKGVIRW